MFKRKDWVFLRKGQGVGGEASSSSSSEEADSGLTSESTEDSSQEEVEPEQCEAETPSTDSIADEENTLANQIDEWCRAARSGETVKGKALTCTICAGKKLLLNSSMFTQHTTSGKHKSNVSLTQNLDNGDWTEMFCFADDCTLDAHEDVETHAERLQRVKSLSFKDADQLTTGGQNKRKRKTRPGKRQRQEMKVRQSS